MRRFRINEKARNLLESLSTLQAKRNLGAVEKDRLEALGFGENQGELILRFKKNEEKILVGEKDVSGRPRYIKLANKAPVYVIDNRLMTDLEFADSRLMEANLVPFDLAEVVAFNVASPWGGTNDGFAQERILPETETRRPIESIHMDHQVLSAKSHALSGGRGRCWHPPSPSNPTGDQRGKWFTAIESGGRRERSRVPNHHGPRTALDPRSALGLQRM